jgi:hypothetical protein
VLERAGGDPGLLDEVVDPYRSGLTTDGFDPAACGG